MGELHDRSREAQEMTRRVCMCMCLARLRGCIISGIQTAQQGESVLPRDLPKAF